MNLSIDIFCHIVDNYGDIGFVYRFARELRRSRPSLPIRVFVDDLTTFKALEPRVDCSKARQDLDSVQYLRTDSLDPTFVDVYGSAEIVVEAFGCEIPDTYMDKACTKSLLWINLEHLSAEEWVGGYHCKESLLGRGTIKKFFFMPGFTVDTGGVIIGSADTEQDQALKRQECLHVLGAPLNIGIEQFNRSLLATLFTYEKDFSTLLSVVSSLEKESYLFVFGEKSRASIGASLENLHAKQEVEGHWSIGNAHILFVPFLAQEHYDSLLGFTDFNLVRGEDSLVRAILSGKPFIWHAYIQDKGYQAVKVEALLKRMEPFFENKDVFRNYAGLMAEFNASQSRAESGHQTGSAIYFQFLGDLEKIGRATADMGSFMARNCSLIDKFVDFAETKINQ
jgi:uncharacterized repeat protein (TIGR03837 family)